MDTKQTRTPHNISDMPSTKRKSPSTASEEGESSSSSSESNSPTPQPQAQRPRRKRAATGTRKRTHWLVLVKAIYAAKDPKGSTGLTAAMKEGPSHLAAFKEKFAEVPTEEEAVEWVKARL